MRVFLDANILFSAAKSDGAIRRLLWLIQEKGHECRANLYVVGEAERNLLAKYPEHVPELANLLRSIQVEGCVTNQSLPESIAGRLPEKDRPVLAAAIELQCDVLLTGDKTHFGPLSGEIVSGVTIHSPASLYAQIV